MQRLYLHALVAELMATLEADGQPFGTGEHLRIGELLQNLPENTAPEQLKTLLAPVLCTTKEEQERFYQIFERSWKQVEAVGVLDVETDSHSIFSPVKTRITPWAALTTALVLIGLWGIGDWAGRSSKSEIPIAFHAFSATVGDPEKSLQIDSLVEQSFTDGKQKFSVDPLSKFSAKKEAGYAGIRLDTQANRIFYSGLKEGSDTVWLRAHPHGWHHTQVWRHQIVFSVYPPPDTSKKEDAPLDTALYVQRPIPHPRDLTQLEAPQPTALQQFMLDWEWPLKVAAMLLAGLLVWFSARLWERNRRKLITEHRPNQKPPYAWSIQLKNPPRVDLGERFHRLLSQLRRREADENWRLDVPRTLRATIAKGGVPQFRFAQQTRPSEYLLLIDRHSPRNHQAQLFDLMFRGFRNQEVLLERFWYDGDPRLCWNEAHPAGLDPRALHYHYPQSRVLLFGDAEQLLNQETGRLSKWATQTFSAWQDRAVLSPKPLNAWGRREHALQELFHVLPVSLSALEVAIERFETDVEKDAELDPRRFPDAAQAQIQLIDNDLIKTLEHYFSNDQSTNHQSPVNQSTNHQSPVNQSTNHQSTNHQLPIWIAACAVYPELHWDMTLYLGDLLSDTNTQLLTADNIAQICRMPWFTEGEIPLEARKTLLAWLEREQPDTLHHIREGIHRLLAQNPPPEDSAAHDAYSMNMALNEWLYTKDSARKKELEKDILRRIAAGQAADFMVLKILEGPRSPEEFEVPENWRKHLKQKGLARATRRSWVWAVPLWVLVCAGVVGWKPDQVGCKGVAMTTQGKEWCAETLEEVLEVWEMQVLNGLGNQDSTTWRNLADMTVKDILKTGREFAWTNQSAQGWQKGLVIGPEKNSLGLIDSISFFQNLAVRYFNQGVNHRDSLQNDTLSCTYFNSAQQINALLPGTAQLWYVSEAARACNVNLISNSIQKSPPILTNWDLNGELRNENTGELLDVFTRSIINVTANGLHYYYKMYSTRFRLIISDSWNSPLIISAIVPGFDTATTSVVIKSFKEGKTLTFKLRQKKADIIPEKSTPDRDNDGVPDSEDKCPDEKGTVENGGCPTVTPTIADRDGDGVADAEDKCPDEKGDLKNGGCPTTTQTISDRDGDGVPDAEDKCPEIKGAKGNSGCPTDQQIRSQMIGFWLLESIELNEPTKLITEITPKGIINYQYFSPNNLPMDAFSNKWDVEGGIWKENRKDGAFGKATIESLDNNGFAIKIIDNGDPAYANVIRKYRRIQPADRDGDGVMDVVDNCPDDKGPKDKGGCPKLISVKSNADGNLDYINRYRTVAIQASQKYGVPSSILLALGILESSAGTSELAQSANNHFGLKCRDKWNGKTYRKIDDDRDKKGNLVKSCFRKYKSAEDSYYDHCQFLVEQFGPLLKLGRTDYKGWAKGLQSSGYVTSNDFANILIRLIERYNLYELDK